jgi:hypothetical protein
MKMGPETNLAVAVAKGVIVSAKAATVLVQLFKSTAAT